MIYIIDMAGEGREKSFPLAAGFKRRNVPANWHSRTLHRSGSRDGGALAGHQGDYIDFLQGTVSQLRVCRRVGRFCCSCSLFCPVLMVGFVNWRRWDHYTDRSVCVVLNSEVLLNDSDNIWWTLDIIQDLWIAEQYKQALSSGIQFWIFISHSSWDGWICII